MPKSLFDKLKRKLKTRLYPLSKVNRQKAQMELQIYLQGKCFTEESDVMVCELECVCVCECCSFCMVLSPPFFFYSMLLYIFCLPQRHTSFSVTPVIHRNKKKSGGKESYQGMIFSPNYQCMLFMVLELSFIEFILFRPQLYNNK